MTFHNKIFAVYLLILALLAAGYCYLIVSEQVMSGMKTEYIRMVRESKNVMSRVNVSHNYAIERNLGRAIGGLSEAEKASIENSKKLLSEPEMNKNNSGWEQMNAREKEECIIRQLTDECSRHDSLEILEQVSRKAMQLFPQFTPVVQIEPKSSRAGDAVKVGISIIDCPPVYDNPNLSLKVDGRVVLMEKGIGHFGHIFRKPGYHLFDTEVSVTNPVTRQTDLIKGHPYPIFISQ